jgi:exopolysaccharide production protein ExoZ
MALGDASYSIYLTHVFTLSVLRAVWRHFAPTITSMSASILFMATALVLSALAGWACYLLVERPMMKAFKRLERPKTAIHAAGLVK